MARIEPVDPQRAVRPSVPAPPGAGTGERGGRPAGRRRTTAVERVRPVGAAMCVVGALLVVTSAALVHLTPPVAATAPLATAQPVSGLALPAPAAPARAPLPVATASSRARARTAPAPRTDAEAPPPRGLRIGAVGVDTPLVNLRRQRDGALEVPADFARAGWYRDGVKPGDRGPAVLVGHVDSYEGPAVFHRLHELRKDDRIVVTRTDGSQVEFAVYDQETVAKDAFPTARVYGDTDQPELRLLTCGGPFDTQTRHYLDNVVVYARLVSR